MPTKHTLLSLFNKDFQNPPVSRNKINFNKKGHTTVNKEHLHECPQNECISTPICMRYKWNLVEGNRS